MDLPGFYAEVVLCDRSGLKIILSQFPPGSTSDELALGQEHLCWDNCMRSCKELIEDNCYKSSAASPKGIEEQRTEWFSSVIYLFLKYLLFYRI
jgi:hypothetical protein